VKQKKKHSVGEDARFRLRVQGLRVWPLGLRTYERPNLRRLFCRALGVKPCTLDLPPFSLNLSPYTLHPTPYTLHPSPYTLHHPPFTRHAAL